MPALCPELAKEPRPIIITVANADNVIVNTYSRVPGTKVTLGCFVPTSFVLRGSNVLTCLTNGSWDKPVPKCVRIETASSTTVPQSTVASPSELTLLPYFVGIGLAGVICLLLAILLCCAAHYWRHDKKKDTDRRDSSPGSTSTCIQDIRHVPLDENRRDSWRLRPGPPVSVFSDRDLHMTYTPRPAWMAMLPRQEEMIIPYI